jgi:Zn-dependent alcohol dehydrogenase
MKAAVFYEPEVPVSVEELEIDAPPPGEVLLDIVGAGVCHSDYHYVSGHIILTPIVQTKMKAF